MSYFPADFSHIIMFSCVADRVQRVRGGDRGAAGAEPQDQGGSDRAHEADDRVQKADTEEAGETFISSRFESSNIHFTRFLFILFIRLN